MNPLSPGKFTLPLRQFGIVFPSALGASRFPGTILARRIGSFAWAVWLWLPITPLGAIASMALCCGFQIEHGDRVLLGIELAASGLLTLCMLAVLATAVGLRLRRESRPTEALCVETDFAFRTGYYLGFAARNPLVRVDVAWQQPMSAQVEIVFESGRFCEKATAQQRGKVKQLVRRFVIGDIFGLARVQFRLPMPMDLTIKPRGGRANPWQLLQQQISGELLSHPDGKPEGDLIEMRRYISGDPLKLVLWKVYARSGQLLVRQPERSIANTRKTLVHLASAKGDEPAAGICRAALETGALGSGVLFGSDLDELPTLDLPAALDQLVRSSSARPQGGLGLAKTLAAGAQQGYHACVVFVPPQPGEWLDRLVNSLASYRGQRRAIVGVDGPLPAGERRGWSRWLVKPQPIAHWSAADLQETCRRLTEVGVEVSVVDRTSGVMRRAGDLCPPGLRKTNSTENGALSCR